MKYYEMSSLIWRREITKNFDLAHSDCNVQTKNWENPIFRNAISRDQNLTKFYNDIHFAIRKQPWKFQIYISNIRYFTDRSLM